MFKFQSVGADPEFFVKKDGRVIPFFLFNKSKQVLTNGVSYYPDNALLELNVPPVSGVNKIKNLTQNINDALDFVSEAYEVSILRSPVEWVSYEGDDALWTKVGCQPFFVLGKGQVKPVPYESNVRVAGGHIHLGYDTSLVRREVVVMVLDKVLYGEDPYRNVVRDSFYGQRGAYRPKPYGVEYRSLSNYWVKDPSWLIGHLLKVEAVINKLIEKGVK